MNNPIPTLEHTIARMQSEVLADVRSGKVNASVSSVSQLHDYVDANEYGGFCDGALLDALIQNFGGRDYNGAMPDKKRSFISYSKSCTRYSRNGITKLCRNTSRHGCSL